MHLSTSPAVFSPVLHVAVSPDGLLHVGVALRGKPGPRLLGLGCALGSVVPVAPLAAPHAASTSTPAATAAATARWRCGAEATQSVLAAAFEVVLGTGE